MKKELIKTEIIVKDTALYVGLWEELIMKILI